MSRIILRGCVTSPPGGRVLAGKRWQHGPRQRATATVGLGVVACVSDEVVGIVAKVQRIGEITRQMAGDELKMAATRLALSVTVVAVLTGYIVARKL
jgi:hypothetical protein